MNHEVKSAARVLGLIEFLAGCSEPVTLKEITTELGCPKSSAHALAQTLVSRGYAIQDSADRYLLVHGNRHGSSVRAGEARLLSAAHPVMEELRDHSGETVLLSVRTVRGEIKRLAKCVSRQSVRYDTDLDGPPRRRSAPPPGACCWPTGRHRLSTPILRVRGLSLIHRSQSRIRRACTQFSRKCAVTGSQSTIRNMSPALPASQHRSATARELWLPRSISAR
jgi:hypothetical protein